MFVLEGNNKASCGHIWGRYLLKPCIQLTSYCCLRTEDRYWMAAWCAVIWSQVSQSGVNKRGFFLAICSLSAKLSLANHLALNSHVVCWHRNCIDPLFWSLLKQRLCNVAIKKIPSLCCLYLFTRNITTPAHSVTFNMCKQWNNMIKWITYHGCYVAV